MKGGFIALNSNVDLGFTIIFISSSLHVATCLFCQRLEVNWQGDKRDEAVGSNSVGNGMKQQNLSR